MITLTKRQREILTRMRDEEEDIAADGRSVYCGLEKISPATLHFFIEHVLISKTDYPGSIYWHINESGKLLLDGRQDIYCMADGTYTDDWMRNYPKETQ